MSVLLCFFAIALSLSLPQQAQAQLPLFDEAGRSYQPNVWQFDLQTTYYQATANYTKDGGQFKSLPDGSSYNLLDFDFGTRWNAMPNWSFYASARVSNAESRDTLSTRRNSTITQAVLGTDYKFFANRRFELIPDFSLTLPIERVDATADEVLNREGAIELNGRMIGRLRWGRFFPFAFVGFTYRDEDRSSLVPYGLGAETQISRWLFGAELRGYQTVIKDKYTNDTLKREAVAAKNGGSLRYYSVDPSLLETNLWVKRPFYSSWIMKLGAGTSMTGASTSAGWNVIAGLTYFFEPSGRSTPTRNYQPVEETSQFQEETNDGVDQNLFQAPPPPPPPKPTPEQDRQKIQQDLNQTEFKIELKHTKKKH